MDLEKVSDLFEVKSVIILHQEDKLKKESNKNLMENFNFCMQF